MLVLIDLHAGRFAAQDLGEDVLVVIGPVKAHGGSPDCKGFGVW